jgi:predicted metallo-beta-lactamase superfamily hydrolase
MKKHLEFQPLWFDSMGAKSTSTLVKTPDITIVIDPGVAIMQPSFPASSEQKAEWLAIAENRIKEACEKADIITISHYHYDHYFPDDFNVYRGKTVYAKNPNEYINNNQRERGEKFFNDIFKEFEIDEKEKFLTKQKKTEYRDPLYDIPHAASKDFKSYNERRKEVLCKGRKRFKKHAKNWLSYEQLPEIKSDNIEVIFPEEKTFKFGDTKLRFTKPLFHGIEYAGVGWVLATIIEYGDKKLFHSSDLSGPMIEDYADLIIKENPSILFLDGPTTYLFGYILNRINLERTIENTARIIREIDADVIIYDHHLTRESKFRDRTKKVWDTAIEMDKRVMTASEYLGEKTVVEILE